MAEYTEVIKHFKRMCKSISPVKCTRGECPMGCENIGQCRKVAFERPEKFEEQVMAWAAENPEPVYPTWGEWLESAHIVNPDPDAVCNQHLLKAWYYDSYIPADIAQKLGIEPKEG